MATQAVTTQAPSNQIESGGELAAFVPRNLSEAFRLADAMHKSGMAPKSFNNAEQVMIAMMAGAEVGLKPFQAVRSIAVINGNPSLWGDGFLAILRANGMKVREWFEGEGDKLTAHCEVIRPDNGEATVRSFSVAQAKKAKLWTKSGPWQDYPERMLQMRARGFAGRDGAADVLKGFSLAEEVMDTPVQGPAVKTVKLAHNEDDKIEDAPPEAQEAAVEPEVAPDATEQPKAPETAPEGSGEAADPILTEKGFIGGAARGVARAETWEAVDKIVDYLRTEKPDQWKAATATKDHLRLYRFIRTLPVWEEGAPMDKLWAEIKKETDDVSTDQ